VKCATGTAHGHHIGIRVRLPIDLDVPRINRQRMVVWNGGVAKDWKNLNRNAIAFLKLASIRLMLRTLCNP